MWLVGAGRWLLPDSWGSHQGIETSQRSFLWQTSEEIPTATQTRAHFRSRFQRFSHLTFLETVYSHQVSKSLLIRRLSCSPPPEKRFCIRICYETEKSLRCSLTSTLHLKFTQTFGIFWKRLPSGVSPTPSCGLTGHPPHPQPTC